MRKAKRFISREKQVFLVGFSLTFPRFPRKSKNRLNISLLVTCSKTTRYLFQNHSLLVPKPLVTCYKITRYLFQNHLLLVPKPLVTCSKTTRDLFQNHSILVPKPLVTSIKFIPYSRRKTRFSLTNSLIARYLLHMKRDFNAAIGAYDIKNNTKLIVLR